MNDSGLNSVHKDFTYHFTKCAIISNITMYFARVTVLKKIDTKQNYVVQQCDDYVQSANTLFHFMQRYEYLSALLRRRALVPRYCQENIAYLNLKIDENKYDQILVLQKCFCDIPFHKLTEVFEIRVILTQRIVLPLSAQIHTLPTMVIMQLHSRSNGANRMVCSLFSMQMKRLILPTRSPLLSIQYTKQTTSQMFLQMTSCGVCRL